MKKISFFVSALMLTVATGFAQQRVTHIGYNAAGEKTDKTELTNDAYGNLSLQIGYLWNSGKGDWEYVNKTESVYPPYENAQPLSQAQYKWNSEKGEWQHTGYQWESTQTTTGEPLSWRDYQWDSTTGELQSGIKTDWTYNANGVQTSFIEYEYSDAKGKWLLRGMYNESVSISYAYNIDGDSVRVSKYYSTTDESGDEITDGYNCYLNRGSGIWTFRYEKTKRADRTYDANGNLISYIYCTYSEDVWIKESKDEYTYDANGNQTSSIFYTWDSETSAWVGYNKSEAAYYDKWNKTLDASYTWSSETNSWVGRSKREISYDTNGYWTLIADYDWNSTTNDWVCSGKSERTLDANGNETSSISHIRNNTTNELVITSKTESTYDSNGNQTESVSYSYNSSGVLTTGNKTEQAFDNNNDQLSYINYFLNPETQEWIVGSGNKTEVTYDASGNAILKITYVWDKAIGGWNKYKYKDEYTYDANGNITDNISYQWSAETNEWINANKREDVSDANGKQILSVGYLWNSETNNWYKSSETIYTDLSTATSVISIDKTGKAIGYYTIHGAKLPKEPEKGLYIIIYDNGKAEKVLK